jgi:SAM-dependent methyltransferase
MNDAAFIRYLASKKTVDDRALNRRVWDQTILCAAHPSPRVLELGGGIGTMVERVAADGRLAPRSWTLIDSQPALIEEARRRLAGRSAPTAVRAETAPSTVRAETAPSTVRAETAPSTVRAVPFELELIASGLEEYAASGFAPFDLVVANAFLDLFDTARVLPTIRALCRPSGHFLFSITFDGLTALEPEIDADLDRRVLELYHRTMDERVVSGAPSGDSRCGRHLLTLLPRCGYRVLEAGSSDWIVHPRDGEYPADERFFLSCILGFFEESLSARPELRKHELARWLKARRDQLAAGELVFIAHQLDVLAGAAEASGRA